MTSCASASERIHSSSSNCFEVGSFSFFGNNSCVFIEQEAALFRHVACSPLDRENIKTPEQPSPLTQLLRVQVFPVVCQYDKEHSLATV